MLTTRSDTLPPSLWSTPVEPFLFLPRRKPHHPFFSFQFLYRTSPSSFLLILLSLPCLGYRCLLCLLFQPLVSISLYDCVSLSTPSDLPLLLLLFPPDVLYLVSVETTPFCLFLRFPAERVPGLLSLQFSSSLSTGHGGNMGGTTVRSEGGSGGGPETTSRPDHNENKIVTKVFFLV